VTDVMRHRIASWLDVSPNWLEAIPSLLRTTGASSPTGATVVAALDNVSVPGVVRWYAGNLVPGEVYRLTALVEGSTDSADRPARIVLDGVESGLGLSVSEVGSHVRLHGTRYQPDR
jgi:hypothetical protein